MAHHHIVQDKYLAQWRIKNTVNLLHVFIVSENKYNIRNTKSKLFYKKDYNIIYSDKAKSDLPEKISSKIDTLGINVIREIDAKNQKQLSNKQRSALSFYIALQRIRTPKYRIEFNKILDNVIKNNINEDATILKNYNIELNNSGHSKAFLKIDKIAKDFFDSYWTFLVPKRGSFFITSDNPCFICLPNIILFPLRPDLCICIFVDNKNKSTIEHYQNIDKKDVKNINLEILRNSSNCIISLSKEHIENITKNFDYTKHKRYKDVTTNKKDPYTILSLE